MTRVLCLAVVAAALCTGCARNYSVVAHNASDQTLFIEVRESDSASAKTFATLIGGPGSRLDVRFRSSRAPVLWARRTEKLKPVGDPIVLSLLPGGHVETHIQVLDNRVMQLRDTYMTGGR